MYEWPWLLINADDPDILMQLVITNSKKERVITTYPYNYYCRPYYLESYYYHPYSKSE
jgi:hypothetical protein